jgi:hypothetical protein
VNELCGPKGDRGATGARGAKGHGADLTHEPRIRKLHAGQYALALAFFSLLIFAIVGFMLFEQQADALCRNSQSSREGVREIVTTLVPEDHPDRPVAERLVAEHFGPIECPPPGDLTRIFRGSSNG